MKNNLSVKIFFLIVIFSAFFSSCGIQQRKAAMLSAAKEIDDLKTELSKVKGQLAQRNRQLARRRDVEKDLSALIVHAYNEEDYTDLFIYTATFAELFPDSENYELYKSYYDFAVSELTEAKKRSDEQDANEATGIWTLVEYEKNKFYLTAKERLAGSANSFDWENQLCYLEIMIFSETKVSFSLMDEDGATLLNGTKTKAETWNITVKDGSGKNHTFKGTCKGDTIDLNSGFSKLFHSYLQSGGYIQLSFNRYRDVSGSYYDFNIQSAAFYNNAFRKLKSLL